MSGSGRRQARDNKDNDANRLLQAVFPALFEKNSPPEELIQGSRGQARDNKDNDANRYSFRSLLQDIFQALLDKYSPEQARSKEKDISETPSIDNVETNDSVDSALREPRKRKYPTPSEKKHDILREFDDKYDDAKTKPKETQPVDTTLHQALREEKYEEKKYDALNALDADDKYRQSKSTSKCPWLYSFFSSSIPAFIGNLRLPDLWLDEAKVTKNFLYKTTASTTGTVIKTDYVTTYDGARIKTIEITPIVEKSNNKKFYIIKFSRNGDQYQDDISEYAKEAVRLNRTIIAFNYRGVEGSSGELTKFQDQVTDGIAQVEQLLKNGVASENILLDGSSFGGTVATMVADHFHQFDIPVYLFNDRSPAKLSKAVVGTIAPKLSGLIGDLDIARAYKAIPAAYKAYMVVAEKENYPDSKGDGVIPYKASLHYSVEQDEKNGISTCNIVLAKDWVGHNLRRSALISASNPNLTGEHLFNAFECRSRLKVNTNSRTIKLR